MPGNFPGSGSTTALPAPAHWQQARVLVVDDHCTYRLLTGSLLAKLGVAHQACSNGQSALLALGSTPFDLVISDCRMPVMDGFAMTSELRRREQAQGVASVPVLALTACMAPEEIRQCKACGMNDWLIKPIGLEQLRDVLLRWLAPVGGTPDGSGAASLHRQLPNRASLVATFGSWDVVHSMLVSLTHEARQDLSQLDKALVEMDSTLTAQCLHRLVGSVVFLGETGLERRAVQLIDRVNLVGVEVNGTQLCRLRRDIELYIECLESL